jgi:hypothetical protein
MRRRALAQHELEQPLCIFDMLYNTSTGAYGGVCYP